MEITKEQIEVLENRLKKNGLTYWDIRIEILDHLVSEIEHLLSKEISYKSAVEQAFQKLNLQGNLEGLNRSRLLGINKIVRKQYFNNAKQLFLKPISLLITTLSFIIYLFIFFFASAFIFKITTFIFLLSPVIVGLVLYFLEFLQKKKSGYLVYSSFYIFFSFLMLNAFFQFFKPDGIISVSRDTQLIIWFVVTCINGVFTSAGIKTYLNTMEKLKNVKKELIK